MSEETFMLLLELGRACNAWDASRGKDSASPTESGQRVAPSREGLALFSAAQAQKDKVIEYAKKLAIRVDLGRG